MKHCEINNCLRLEHSFRILKQLPFHFAPRQIQEQRFYLLFNFCSLQIRASVHFDTSTCFKQYICETKRRIKDRLNEHRADQLRTLLISPNPQQSQNIFLITITLLTTSHLFHQHSLNLIERVYENVEKHTSSREAKLLNSWVSIRKMKCNTSLISSIFNYLFILFLLFNFFSYHNFNGFCLHTLSAFTFFLFQFFCFIIESYCTLFFISNCNVLTFRLFPIKSFIVYLYFDILKFILGCEAQGNKTKEIYLRLRNE